MRTAETAQTTSFGALYQGRRVLVTGHTGFKGSWLALWLQTLGAEVAGIALAPPGELHHWGQLGLHIDEDRLDIRDGAALNRAVQRVAPEIVFHLAAQPLVRHSYADPSDTWSTNVMGTVNVLEACRAVGSVRAVVVITTDKCYANREWVWGYRESDRLGGSDPYSASKAATELVVDSYRRSFFSGARGPLLASARAGNVLGGGDWAADRLVPDLARAALARAPLEIRSPGATRPWQHVLDALAGYLMLGRRLLQGERAFADAWNFGPDESQSCSVEQLLLAMRQHWPGLAWRTVAADLPETHTLRLDSTKARQLLGWTPTWDLAQTLHMTSAWYQSFLSHGSVVSAAQLAAFRDASGRRCP